MAEEKNTETKKVIMLVEDDPFVMEIYQTKLEQTGFEVVGILNGVEALKKMDEVNPDLILLDILMPYMDGLEVLEKIKKSKKFKNIPVIMLTNFSQKEEVDRGMELGASDYLIKSHFTPSEVLKKIKIFLNEK